MNAASKEETASIVEAFPYGETLRQFGSKMDHQIQRCAPGAPVILNDEWRDLMKRAIEGAFDGGDPMPIVIDTFHGGSISPRTHAYVGSLACKLYVAERQQVDAA